MSLASGARLGPYEVTSRIGAGGMGEVYHAIDTNLKRAVAIKVLPELVAADVERLARFQREAEVLAALNHPNIAAIYGLERSASTPATIALVMELVEGPTLADRIAQGPIPFDEALAMAKQIAAALESAHEQNIIHRDLKPANIKLRSDGAVKVLDFGLAKAMEQTGTASSNLSMSPTISSPAMTQAGIILGTAAYMSPEQAKGRAVDKRTDVWAFGAVLYEMLTGRRLFTGEEVTETLAAVLMKEPDWSALPTAVPPPVVTVLRRCLQKDPKQRMRDIGDVSLALDGVLANPASEPSLVVPAPAPPSRVRMLVTAGFYALVGALVAVVILWLGTQHTPAPTGPVRLSIVTPANRPVAVQGFPSRALAISPTASKSYSWLEIWTLAGKSSCNCARSMPSQCAIFLEP
jgi:eukaryotic-like serine/threonine-protein kinase